MPAKNTLTILNLVQRVNRVKQTQNAPKNIPAFIMNSS